MSNFSRERQYKIRVKTLFNQIGKLLTGRKFVFHTVLWVLAGLWLLFSPYWRYKFFVQEGKPVVVLEQPPEETGGIRHSIGNLVYWSEGAESHEEGETYSLWGWAFTDVDRGVAQTAFYRFVVLTNQGKAYFYSMEVFDRPDVQEAFKELGFSDLTPSGFYAVISRNSLPVGEYKVGLYLKSLQDTSLNYFVETDKLLVRTPNHLLLETISK